MRQLRWTELLSDYDCEIRYHPGKANVIAYALSCKSHLKSIGLHNVQTRTDIQTRIFEAQHVSVTEGNLYEEMSCGAELLLEKPRLMDYFISLVVFGSLIGTIYGHSS